MSLLDSPSSLRRNLRWVCLVIGALITFHVGYVWLRRLTTDLQLASAEEEIGFALGNVVAFVFVVWLLSAKLRRWIGCPSLIRWLFSWRILRRGLIGLAGFITLVAAFYTVENWRGRRAWGECRRELEAKGEILDWEKFIPPPIPDAENFFKAPGMLAWFSKAARETNQSVRVYSVPEAMSLLASPGGTLERIRSFPEEAPEVGTSAAAVSRAGLRAAFVPCEPEYRLLADACKRPRSRLADNYGVPFNVDIPSFVNARQVAQTLSVHASLSVLDGKPDVAVADLAMMRRVGEVMDDSHVLVGTMIHVAIQGLYLQTARDALEAGLWKEPQLVALGEQTRKPDLLGGFVQSMRGGERAGAIRALDWPPDELAKLFSPHPGPGGANAPTGVDWPLFFTRLQLELCPRGWIQQNQASLARSGQELFDSFDPGNRRIHAARLDTMSERLQKLASSRSPYAFLAARALPNFLRAVQVVARNQTQLDQLRVACALERFRLAHGNYPEKIEALIPALLDQIPQDLFADGPMKYRRDDQGGYVLWSIGWDERDDASQASKPAYDASPGDWAWRSPPGRL